MCNKIDEITFYRIKQMARRKDHTHEELETLILEASKDIIAKKGTSELTARKLATTIGYTPGTIYNVFGNMDNVLIRINADTMDRLRQALSNPNLYKSSHSLEKSLNALAEAYANYIALNRPFWLMLFEQNPPQSRQNSDWYLSKIEDLFKPLETLLTTYLTGAKKRNIAIIARTLWASVHGIYMLQETGHLHVLSEPESSKRMTKLLIKKFVVGLE